MGTTSNATAPRGGRSCQGKTAPAPRGGTRIRDSGRATRAAALALPGATDSQRPAAGGAPSGPEARWWATMPLALDPFVERGGTTYGRVSGDLAGGSAEALAPGLPPLLPQNFPPGGWHAARVADGGSWAGPEKEGPRHPSWFPVGARLLSRWALTLLATPAAVGRPFLQGLRDLQGDPLQQAIQGGAGLDRPLRSDRGNLPATFFVGHLDLLSGATKTPAGCRGRLRVGTAAGYQRARG
jgi:hypothetical protein